MGNRIKEERLKRNLSQTKLANAVHKDYSVIATYETGKNRIPVDVLLRIANYFKIPMTKFLKLDDSDIDLIPYTNHNEIYDSLSESVEFQKLSVYSEVGAGNFVDFSDYNPITEFYIKKEFYRKNMVAVKVKGDSMSPTIKKNGYIGVDINDREYVEGEIFAVRVPNEGVTVKRVIIYRDQKKIILRSDNSFYGDRELSVEYVDEENFLIGRVKWVMQEI